MTIEEIQEYIKKQIEKYDEIPNEYQDAKFKQATSDLVIVLGMLDELEPKEAHYIELERFDETEPFEYRCSSCRRTFYFEDVDKYCCKCGAKMTNAKEILEV